MRKAMRMSAYLLREVEVLVWFFSFLELSIEGYHRGLRLKEEGSKSRDSGVQACASA